VITEERFIKVIHAALFDVDLPIDVMLFEQREQGLLAGQGQGLLTDMYIDCTVERTGMMEAYVCYEGFAFSTVPAQPMVAGATFHLHMDELRRGLTKLYPKIVMVDDVRPSSTPCSVEQSGRRGWISRLFRHGRAA
jgi:hypothetical protein